LLLCLYFVAYVAALKAQVEKTAPPVILGKNDTIKTLMTKLDGELVPWIVTPEVRIVDTRIFASAQDRANFYPLALQRNEGIALRAVCGQTLPPATARFSVNCR
jgi:hypothetical protein